MKLSLRSRLFLTRILAIAVLAVFIAGCATVPFTGRKQFSFIPQSELVALGASSYSELIENSTLSRNAAERKMVSDVGRAVAASAERFMRENGMKDDLRHYDWEFELIEDDEVINAFCMPGGKIAVYTGILPVARNIDGLGVVIGHEVAHAIATHGGERMSQLLLAQLGGIALSKALEDEPEKTQQLLFLAYGIGAQVGVLLPYSRKHESEADHIGLILMAQASYDPRTAVGFWERMDQASGGAPPEFLSTHPSPDTRIKDINTWIPEAMKYYQQ